MGQWGSLEWWAPRALLAAGGPLDPLGKRGKLGTVVFLGHMDPKGCVASRDPRDPREHRGPMVRLAIKGPRGHQEQLAPRVQRDLRLVRGAGGEGDDDSLSGITLGSYWTPWTTWF